MKKLLLTISLLLMLAVAGGPAPSYAAGVDRGVMKVEHLYTIDYAGGRTEKLREPMDLFYDRKSKELYIVDAAMHKILVYDQNGIFLQAINSDVASGNGGLPRALAVDGAGRVFAGYLDSPRINVMDFKGEFLDSFLLPGGLEVPGNNVRPAYMAQGPDGSVFVLKTGGGVIKLDPAGSAHEQLDISGEGSPNMIFGMTIDNEGRFLFTDMRPYSVVIYDPKKKEFKRFGSGGVLYEQLARPQGIAADDAGHIFVVSLVTHKVSCYDRNGKFIEEFGKFGDRQGQFYMPTKIASDGKDRLYVLENTLKRVQVFRVEFTQEKEVVQGSSDSSKEHG